jgi:hypothetical protein
LISNKTTPSVRRGPEWATAIFHWARTTAASFGKLYWGEVFVLWQYVLIPPISRGDFSASLHHLAVLTASRWAPGLSLAVRAQISAYQSPFGILFKIFYFHPLSSCALFNTSSQA